MAGNTSFAYQERAPVRRFEDGVLLRFGRLALHQPLGLFGAFLIFSLIAIAVLAPFIAPHDPLHISFAHSLEPPSAIFPLGTDHFGRDMLSRLMYGAQTAMYIGLVAAFIAGTISLVLGVTSAYLGGTFDLLFQRFADVWMAIPDLILAMVIVMYVGTGLENVILVIVIVSIPGGARIVRSSALALREFPYIDAARANGFSHTRIVLRHMIPNVMAPFLVLVTAGIGRAILAEASLSYLGLGVQEPTPAWGLMLRDGVEEFFDSAPWVVIWPGLAITIAVFGINILGDAIRDLLDPKLRK
ncbi:MAG: ABC transporter permease [Hyphomicrobiaceae bacterium]